MDVELNLRASRSMPFSSKSVGINLIGESLKGIFESLENEGFCEPEHKAFAVKSPQFSWAQMRGAYPHLGPEMGSTGESAALGNTLDEALLKSWLGVQPNKVPEKGILIYGNSNTQYLIDAAKRFSKKHRIYTIEGAGIYGDKLSKEKAKEMIKEGEISLFITDGNAMGFDYEIRRLAVDMNVPIVLNGRLGSALSKAFNAKAGIEEMKHYW
ncbi:MAG: hypothetical protein ACP5RF_02750 [Candidatus Micrarchaeia archaeon]